VGKITSIIDDAAQRFPWSAGTCGVEICNPERFQSNPLELLFHFQGKKQIWIKHEHVLGLLQARKLRLVTYES
jgi:hypothetical protein